MLTLKMTIERKPDICPCRPRIDSLLRVSEFPSRERAIHCLDTSLG